MIVSNATVYRALEITSIVKSSDEEIYSYLTKAPLLSRWLCKHAEADPCQGGKFAIWVGADNSSRPDYTGEFVNLLPCRTVQLTWAKNGSLARSLVTIVVNQREESVRIDLYHTSLPIDQTFDKAYLDYARFWKNALDRLAEHLAA